MAAVIPGDIDQPEIRRRFTHYPPDAARVNEHIEVRQACMDLGLRLARILPPGREKSTAITNLEQVMFWANAAIARQAADPPEHPDDARMRIEDGGPDPDHPAPKE